MDSVKFALRISSSPSARMIRFTGISSPSRIVFPVNRVLAGAPFGLPRRRASTPVPPPASCPMSGASPAMARGNGDRPIRFAVARSAATFLGPPAIANPMLRIEADVLIPGLGDPIKDGALVVDGTTIAYAGPIEGAPSAAGAVVLNVPALMPGMWDVHGHFMGIRTLNVEEIARTPLAVLAARATKDAEVAGSAGFA